MPTRLLDPLIHRDSLAAAANREPLRFVIVGKPGGGRSALAAALATAHGCVHLSVERVVSLAVAAVVAENHAAEAAAAAARATTAVGDSDAADGEDVIDGDGVGNDVDADVDADEGAGSPPDTESAHFGGPPLPPFPVTELARDAHALAVSGASVPSLLGLALLEQALSLELVHFRGYVLDDFPAGDVAPEHVSVHLARLRAWPHAPSVALCLEATDEDITARWADALVDPRTGRYYVTADLAASASMSAEAAQALLRGTADDADGADGAGAEDGDDVDDDGDDNTVRTEPEPVIAPLLPRAPPLPAALLARLVPAPRAQAAVIARLERHAACATTLAQFVAESFSAESRLALNATEPREVVANTALAFVCTVAATAPVFEPIVLAPPEVVVCAIAPRQSHRDTCAGQQAAVDTDDGLRTLMSRAGLDDDDEAPAWATSPYNVYCPVTLVDHSSLVKGSPEWGVAYLGSFFVLKDNVARAAFLANPRRYLQALPRVPTRVLVLGQPPAAASLSHALIQETGAVHLDAQRLALSFLAALDPAAAALYADHRGLTHSFSVGAGKVRVAMTSPNADGEGGGDEHSAPVSAHPAASPVLAPADGLYPAVYDDAITQAVAALPGGRDWVLTGYPRTVPELLALTAKGVVASAVVLIAPPAVMGSESTQSDLRAVWDAARSQNITTVDVQLEESVDGDAMSPYVSFSLLDGARKVKAAVQAPLCAPTVELPNEADATADDQVDMKYGRTRQYCPVAVVRDQQLRVGDAALAVLHDGVFYHCATPEDRALFAAAPDAFLPAATPDGAVAVPPLRLCVLGPAGAGKTTQGRRFASRLCGASLVFADLVAEVRRFALHPMHAAVSESSDGPVPAELAVDLLLPHWRAATPACPLVIIGFPRNEADMRAAVAARMCPEFVLRLDVSGSAVRARLLQKQVALFATHRAGVLDRHTAGKAAAAARRAAFHAAESARLAAGGTESDEPEFVDDAELAAAEAAAAAAVEGLETEPEAKDRLAEALSDAHQAETDALETLSAVVEDELRVPVVGINASLGLSRVQSLIDEKCRKHVAWRASIFLSPRSVSPVTAVRLVQRGLKLASAFGAWCPVCLAQGTAVQPIHAARYPVVQGHHVYHVCGRAHQRALLDDAWTYLSRPAPPPVVPVAISVVGPPRSGKSALCARLANQYNCAHVTVADALQRVLQQRPETWLGAQLRAELESGRTASPGLVVAAVHMRLMDAVCQTQGYVLDEFPATPAQAVALGAAGVLPRVILALQLSRSEALARTGAASDPATGDAVASPATLGRQYDAMAAELANVCTHYVAQHRNWHVLDGTASRFAQAVAARAIVDANTRAVQANVAARKAGRPASVDGLGLTPAHLAAHLSPAGLLCPVTLVEQDSTLVMTPLEDKLAFTLAHNGVYHKLCSAACAAAFAASPTPYTVPGGLLLPRTLPCALSETQVKMAFPRTAAFQGLCPVSYVRGGLSFEALKYGSMAFAVEYASHIYLLAGGAEVAEFMRRPDLYDNIPLPAKRPAKPLHLPVAQLPNLGFMEQTCSQIVTQAVTLVGLDKPKFPYLSSSQSALLYIALYLRAENPKSSSQMRQRNRAKLQRFKEKCELLKFLTQHMKPSFRSAHPLDFERKMTSFLALCQARA